jgi:hypothetical protein
MQMLDGIEVASVIHMRRKTNSVGVKIPLKKLSYKGPRELSEEVKEVVQQEVNVYTLVYAGNAEQFQSDGESSEITDPTNHDLIAGQVRDIVRKIQAERKILGTSFDEKVNVTLADWPKEFEDDIKKKALIKTLQKGETFAVSRIEK